MFLISLKAGGTGAEPDRRGPGDSLRSLVNPAAEDQATDRAHRIGQRHDVDVVKLIAQGTIEEKVTDLSNASARCLTAWLWQAKPSCAACRRRTSAPCSSLRMRERQAFPSYPRQLCQNSKSVTKKDRRSACQPRAERRPLRKKEKTHPDGSRGEAYSNLMYFNLWGCCSFASQLAVSTSRASVKAAISSSEKRSSFSKKGRNSLLTLSAEFFR